MSAWPSFVPCRDEFCSIVGVHPAHRVKRPRGRPHRGEERTPFERSAHAAAHFAELRRKHGAQKLDNICPDCGGKGWVKNWVEGCPTCFGHGRLTAGMRALRERDHERVANV